VQEPNAVFYSVGKTSLLRNPVTRRDGAKGRRLIFMGDAPRPMPRTRLRDPLSTVPFHRCRWKQPDHLSPFDRPWVQRSQFVRPKHTLTHPDACVRSRGVRQDAQVSLVLVAAGSVALEFFLACKTISENVKKLYLYRLRRLRYPEQFGGRLSTSTSAPSETP